MTDAANVLCRACGADVPSGEFCGLCGTHLAPRRGDGPDWLRLNTFAVTPDEHVLRLSVASSIFPQLPQKSRAPFRLALALIVLVMVTFAVLRWQAPLVGVIALGLPVLFLLYLREIGAVRFLPLRALVIHTGVCIALGVGWVLLTGKAVARSYDIALGTALPGKSVWLAGVAIPLGGAVVMLVGALALRLLRPEKRESLDGFTIGAWGAIVFTAAATLTRLAPEFTTGLTTRDRPVSWFFVEAAIRGVAGPLIMASVGGMVGLTLWFGRRSDRHRRAARVVFTLGVGVLLAAYTGLGVADVSRVPQGLQLGLYAVVTAGFLWALRIALQIALLTEDHAEPHRDASVRCPQCEHVVPDVPFCPDCGAARAVCRTSGNEHTTSRRLASTVGASVAGIAAAAAVVTATITPPPVPYVCPPECGRPPIAPPVAINPRFTASTGDFSVSYPGPEMPYESTLDANGVRLTYVGGDGGQLRLFAEPAANRTPRQVADALIKKTFPGATTAYEIPSAAVGYQPGYGEFADVFPHTGSGSFARVRVVVLVAEKNGLDLIATATGPYREFGPHFGTGRPSAANLELALDMDKYVNSFTWRGDPPR